MSHVVCCRGDSSAGAGGAGGGESDPVRGGRAFLPAHPGATAAAHRLLELPGERGGHQVKHRQTLAPGQCCLVFPNRGNNHTNAI